MLKEYLSSSIGKKQIIAITGLMMAMFLITHLSGNLLMFKGPQALNSYSQMLHDLGGILWVARIGLLGAFVAHFSFTIALVIQNRKARGQSYSTSVNKKTRSFTARLMPFSGGILFAYIVIHLLDFTFTDVTAVNAMVNGEFLGLYGLVYNEFMNPFDSLFYIVAMMSVGFHLTHGIQSVMQTYGFNHPVYTPLIKKISVVLGSVIAVGFSSIPVYVLIHSGVLG
jgi:succinate dehydrogenase / fumarate reductase cytochrome b subunit